EVISNAATLTVTSAPDSEATVPEAPGTPISSVIDSAVSVTWTAPKDGGSPITGYTVQLLGGDAPLVQHTAADVTEIEFTNVAAGNYEASVTAVNAVGQSEASAASNTVSVTAVSDPEPEVTAPDAPAAPSASVTESTVTATWEAPADGGSSITGYTVTLT